MYGTYCDYKGLAFNHSDNGQKSVRACVTLFYYLQAKHQIPVKKSDNLPYLPINFSYKYCFASAPYDI